MGMSRRPLFKLSNPVYGSTNEYDAYFYTFDNTILNRVRFFVVETCEIDIYIIGGGGAGGHNQGGGGGAGGMFFARNLIQAGWYLGCVGGGGVGLSGTTTPPTANGDGKPSFLCYDDGYDTLVKFNLNGVITPVIVYGGGQGATAQEGGVGSYIGNTGGSGGGSSDGSLNDFAVNPASTTTQPATYFNGTSYVAGGRAGRVNTTGSAEIRGGGGGGGNG